MASRIGTVLISPVRIQDDTIPQPVAFANEINGGAQSGPSLASRDACPLWNRNWGMFFTVYNDSGNNGTYSLVFGKSSTNMADNGNWNLFAGSGAQSNVKKIDQSILTTGSINLPANCLLYSIIINAGLELPNAKVGYSAGVDDLVMQQDMPAGYNSFNKGVFLPSATTIYFSGIDTQSTCSVIVFQF